MIETHRNPTTNRLIFGIDMAFGLFLGLVVAIAMILLLTSCSWSKSAQARSSSPDQLDPALITKFLRVRADVMEKEVEINHPVEVALEEIMLDCKAKGFDVDPKTGKGMWGWNPDTHLPSCVKSPKPPVTQMAPAQPKIVIPPVVTGPVK